MSNGVRPVLTSKQSNILSPSPSKSNKSRSSSNASSPVRTSSNYSSSIQGGSPIKRSKLSPIKFRPPITTSNSSTSSVNISRSPSASPQKGKLNFTIYEDKVDYTCHEIDNLQVNDVDMDGQENQIINDSHDINDKFNDSNEQENILQPKYKNLPQNKSQQVRKPLQNLSIHEYKGFINQSHDLIEPLTEPFVPKTFKTDSISVHKFHSNTPSYVSPMKSNSKFLFRSGLNVIHDENESNEDDDLEQSLLKKLLMIKRHKRSFSLGKNDLKSDLIKKNGFTILSN